MLVRTSGALLLANYWVVALPRYRLPLHPGQAHAAGAKQKKEGFFRFLEYRNLHLHGFSWVY